MELNEAVRHGQVMTDPADSPSSPVAAVSSPTAWARAVGIGIGLAMLIGVLVTAFAWPATESAPRDVPIAAVASAEATAQLEEQLATAVPGGFELRPVPDIEAARQLIYDREVYGALVLEPAGSPHVLTASAASPVVAQLIQGVAAGWQHRAARVRRRRSRMSCRCRKPIRVARDSRPRRCRW